MTNVSFCLSPCGNCALPPLSGAGSGVQLAGGGPGGGRRRGLPRLPLHRIRERTHQEASRQPRRLHTDQSAAGLLPGEGGEEENKRCLSVTCVEVAARRTKSFPTRLRERTAVLAELLWRPSSSFCSQRRAATGLS